MEESVDTYGETDFPLHPRSRFRNRSRYQTPEEIGHFSVDENRMIVHDKSRLRHLVDLERKEPGNRHVNLKECIEMTTYDDFYWMKRLDHILQWILKHRDMFVDQRRRPQRAATRNTTVRSSTSTNPIIGREEHTDKLSTLNTDFVARRGCLARLLYSLYMRRFSSWKLAVIRFKDTFYLCEMKTGPEDRDKTEDEDKRKERETNHIGLKFERYLTTDEPNIEPLNNCEVYETVMKTKLDKHSLIFNGAVDCVDSDEEYVMLRTNKEFKKEHEKESFKSFKLFKNWAMSFIHGIPKIIYGFHHDGILQRLQTFNTNDIPMKHQSIKMKWNEDTCVSFLNSFLTFIKETIPKNDPRKVYMFIKGEGTREPIKWRVLDPNSDISSEILPQWYIDEFEQ